MKPINIGGIQLDTLIYDMRYKCVDFELVRVDDYYEIHLIATLKNGKFRNLLKLHIKDAIKAKAIIDQLVYDSNFDQHERQDNKNPA